MLSYNMIPIVQDNMNDIGSRVNILTNVSSNAYYGYQPQVYLEEKNAAQTNQTARMDNNTSNMDIQYNNNNNLCYEAMQTENIPRQVNRKRRWDHRDEFVEFKKRRQTVSRRIMEFFKLMIAHIIPSIAMTRQPTQNCSTINDT